MYRAKPDIHTLVSGSYIGYVGIYMMKTNDNNDSIDNDNDNNINNRQQEHKEEVHLKPQERSSIYVFRFRKNTQENVFIKRRNNESIG